MAMATILPIMGMATEAMEVEDITMAADITITGNYSLS